MVSGMVWVSCAPSHGVPQPQPPPPTLMKLPYLAVMPSHGIRTAIAVLAFLSASVSASLAQTFVGLGKAADYAVLGGNINLHNVSVNGDGGVTSNGKISISSPSSLTGDLYMDAGATRSGNAPGGSVIQPHDVDAAMVDAIAAAQLAAGLTPDYIISNINGSLIIQSTGLQTVVNITGDINLSGSDSLYLNGTAGQKFILNVSGSLTMGGSSMIAGNPGSGTGSADILVNVMGSGAKIVTKVDNMIAGTVLAPSRQFEMHSVNGAVIGGNMEMKLMSGASVTQIGFTPIPEPATHFLGLLGCVALLFRRRRG